MVFMGPETHGIETMSNTLGRRGYRLFLFEKHRCKDMQDLLAHEQKAIEIPGDKI